MTSRKRVANRRAHETIAIEHEGQRYKIGIGRELLAPPTSGVENPVGATSSGAAKPLPPSSPAVAYLGPIIEVFVSAQHVNSTMDAVVSDGAILMSMLMQYGCPPAAIVKSMKHKSDGSPSSPLGRAAALINQATQQGE